MARRSSQCQLSTDSCLACYFHCLADQNQRPLTPIWHTPGNSVSLDIGNLVGVTNYVEFMNLEQIWLHSAPSTCAQTKLSQQHG